MRYLGSGRGRGAVTSHKHVNYKSWGCDICSETVVNVGGGGMSQGTYDILQKRTVAFVQIKSGTECNKNSLRSPRFLAYSHYKILVKRIVKWDPYVQKSAQKTNGQKQQVWKGVQKNVHDTMPETKPTASI